MKKLVLVALAVLLYADDYYYSQKLNSCMSGVEDDCVALSTIIDYGHYFDNGEIVQNAWRARATCKDYLKTLKKSCDYNDAAACLSLGNQYDPTAQTWKQCVTKSTNEALKHLKKSCELGAKDGCTAYDNLQIEMDYAR